MRRSASRKSGAGPWRERVTSVHVQRKQGLVDEPEGYEAAGSSGWEDRLNERERMNECSIREDGFESSDEEEEEHVEDDIHSEDDYPIDVLRSHDHYAQEEGEETESSSSLNHHEESDDHQESSDDDPNDIIDIIPSPSGAPRRRAISLSKSLRSRKSFFRSDSGGSPEDAVARGDGSPVSREGGQGRMHGYGTFRSLAGI